MNDTVGRLLEGRTALVTGGSRGIGAATARALGRNGASVAVNYLSNRQAATDVVHSIELDGSKAVAVQGDVCDPHQAAELVWQAGELLGDIEILVCNAVGGPPVFRGTALDSGHEIQARADAQLRATLNVCRLVAPAMRAARSGSIVFVGSSESRSSGPVVADIAVAKAAQDALMCVLAAELGPAGVRVNTVAPGFVPTDGSAASGRPALLDALIEATPLRRIAQAEDVADAIVALSSDLTRHITGAYLPVDGGQIMH
ncbi:MULTISPECIES: SDR family NAD(P)-dependent oxidoreductase [unclassified Streptomyces]|uniref:SDR family NAD(P)-dependent oxidoreductase n=1 Tax=unclassified Streptomyces TaxID=2593676 RepID=UPI00278BF140|nr:MULTISPECIES: SDR family NAD(P)-dependent oxidoreductase [unclassified Streptomyces]